MIIETLVLRPDGTQTLEKREVPDNWYDGETQSDKDEQITEDKI